jgi:lipoprotein-releasing system permease protein
VKTYIPHLSLRYLRYHKVSSALGVLGVALGVGLVIVVVSVMDGFQTRLRKSLLGSTASVTVLPKYVVETSPVLHIPSFASTDHGGLRSGRPCMILAIDPRREGAVNDFRGFLQWPSGPPGSTLLPPATDAAPFTLPPNEARAAAKQRRGKQGVLVGLSLMRDLGLRVGDRIRLYTLVDDGEGDQPRAASETWLITGAYCAGDTEVEKALVLMDRVDALSYFRERLDREVHEMRVRVDDPGRAEEVKHAIEARTQEILADTRRSDGGLDELEVKTWIDVHRVLLGAVEVERSMLIVISSFCFIVVAFLIGATQSMLVIEKTREIGVLRSLGSSVAGTSAIFLGNGFFIGTIGAALGCAIGVSVASNVADIAHWLRGTFGLDVFPQDVYRFDSIPVELRPGFVLVVCAGAIAFALLGSAIPAVRASLLDPVESLHHE